jgi:DNA replication protein DnaC
VNPMPELIPMLKQLRLSGILDSLEVRPQDEDIHDLIGERYERRSTIITSNLDLNEWSDAFPNKLLGSATIDRIRHGAYSFVLDGKSFRATKPLQIPSKNEVAKTAKNVKN